MTVIGTNVAALRAQSGARTAQTQLQTAMERLSTGSRINSAKDDAAGLAISSRMTSQIRGLAVAVRNASDGISMTQTAEGALGEVSNMLQRMKELAVQSSNATLGKSERAALQAETNQLTAQINDISKTTNFNGLKLLDGSTKSLNLQTGVNAGDQIAVTLAGVSSGDLGLTNGSRGTVTSGRVGTSAITTAFKLNGVDGVSESVTPAEGTAAKDLAEAINKNSARTGVSATAANAYTTEDKFESTVSGGTLNGKAIGAAANAEEFAKLVNADPDKYGVTAKVNEDKTITFTNNTGDSISMSGFVEDEVTEQEGFVSLKSTDGKSFEISGTTTGTGLKAFNGASFTGGTDATATSALSGVKINGIEIADTTAGTLAENKTRITNAINAKKDETGVNARFSGDKLVLESVNGGAVRTEGLSTAGFADQGGAEGMSFDLDISSQSAASAAMGVIDKALDTVSAKRGDLGAIQNRLEVTVNSLTTQSTNLADARSRIQDADFSTETTNLAKAQILGQAATAMLAQANQSQQNVLSLLR